MAMNPFNRLARPPVWATYALFTLVVASLMMQLWTLYTLNQVRTTVREQLIILADQVQAAQTSIISADFPVNQRVPIVTNIPVKKSVTVPIKTQVNVDSSVTVPLAGFNFQVPIRADIPVDTNVPVNIDETVAISTTVDLNLTIPIRIPVTNSSFEGILKELEQRLRALVGQL